MPAALTLVGAPTKPVEVAIELIPIQQINHAYERLSKGDVKYRFVIDMAMLR